MSKCDGPECACWKRGFDSGYVEGQRDFGLAVTRSGLVETAALAERQLVEAQTLGLARPVQEAVQVERWHE